MSDAAPPVNFPPVLDLLRRQGIRLEKRKSQHFLRRQEVCRDIAELAGLTPTHTAIEVGTGLGNLTVELAARAGRVVSVELDRAFDDWHQYLCAANPNLEVVPSDFLALDLDALVAERSLGGPVTGIGNLPYQITSEILFRFVNAAATFESCVFMIQREVAARLAAGAGTRESGALTYKVALRYAVTLALEIPAAEFLPPPKVVSAVIVLKPLAAPKLRDNEHRTRLYRLLDGVFQYRRKTLLNCLTMAGLVRSREDASGALARAGINEMRRPENLSLDEVLALEDALHG